MKVSDINDAEFQEILKDLPQDDDWKEDDVFEASYKKRKMPRYVFSKKDTVTAEAVKETKQETFSSSLDSANTQQMLTSGSSEQVVIKVENPEYQALRFQATALKAGEVSLHNISRQLKLLLPALESKDNELCA